MNYKMFPDSWWIDIEAYLQKHAHKQQLVAAFDADGTLWHTDLGENFFNWQIANCPELNLPKDPWSFYLSLKAKHPPTAYLWLAQINKGKSLDEVLRWSQQALQELSPAPLFEAQKKLIDLLQKYQVRVFIVTASISWAVLPGAQLFNIPTENVLGVRTEIRNGLISEVQEGFITYREGKSLELLARTQGLAPFLCSGNSSGDIELLKCATQFKIAVQGARPDQKLYSAEQELLKVARDENWWTHSFI